MHHGYVSPLRPACTNRVWMGKMWMCTIRNRITRGSTEREREREKQKQKTMQREGQGEIESDFDTQKRKENHSALLNIILYTKLRDNVGELHLIIMSTLVFIYHNMLLFMAKLDMLLASVGRAGYMPIPWKNSQHTTS